MLFGSYVNLIICSQTWVLFVYILYADVSDYFFSKRILYTYLCPLCMCVYTCVCVCLCVCVCVCAWLQACSMGVLLVHRVRESQTWGRVWDKISRVWGAMAALREAGDNRYGFWPVGQHHSRSKSLIPRHRVPLVVFLGIFICSLSPSPTSIFRNRLMFH